MNKTKKVRRSVSIIFLWFSTFQWKRRLPPQEHDDKSTKPPGGWGTRCSLLFRPVARARTYRTEPNRASGLTGGVVHGVWGLCTARSQYFASFGPVRPWRLWRWRFHLVRARTLSFSPPPAISQTEQSPVSFFFFLLRRFVRAVLRNANAILTHVWFLHRKGCCCLVLLRLDQ